MALGLGGEELAQALALCRQVHTTLAEQAEGWNQRSLFERQWVIRDFKRLAGMTVEQWLEALKRLEQGLEEGSLAPGSGLEYPLVGPDHLRFDPPGKLLSEARDLEQQGG
jgi:hypothetical protein